MFQNYKELNERLVFMYDIFQYHLIKELYQNIPRKCPMQTVWTPFFHDG